jgi:hypothetical protein
MQTLTNPRTSLQLPPAQCMKSSPGICISVMPSHTRAVASKRAKICIVIKPADSRVARPARTKILMWIESDTYSVDLVSYVYSNVCRSRYNAYVSSGKCGAQLRPEMFDHVCLLSTSLRLFYSILDTIKFQFAAFESE